ncbi:MAG: anti-sigma regulatory factor [Bryobacteraceae bacterium]|nr:anti-sigma regulatory factor [Bryobacteraceae bacterium]
MATLRSEIAGIVTSEDIVRVRHMVRDAAVRLSFSLVDQTKIVTAASELARNTLEYGGGGTVRIDELADHGRLGLQLIFEDRGPGIADLNQAMQDGFTSGSGLGLGLGGAKRLCNEFEIQSKPGEGTRVRVARWK